MLTLNDLRERIQKGEIVQVVMCFPDMYGRLMGKTFDADFFLQSTLQNGTHCCNALFSCDMEMNVYSGSESTVLKREFGDFHSVPDQSSIRLLSWKNGTSGIMCDIYDDEHKIVSFAPRTILRRQVDAAMKLSYDIMSASELEYYTYENSFRDARTMNYEQSRLKPVGDHHAVYQLLQAAREEKYASLFRKHLKASGIPVESNQTEFGRGQHELNTQFTDAFSMADRHVIYKQCLKEIADQLDISVTFMAKPFSDATGSSCHLHLSIFNVNDGTNAFIGDELIEDTNVKCSSLFKHFLAGWMKYTPDMMIFYAPTINSYKRFSPTTLVSTQITWNYDSRTAAFRVIGEDQSLRIEFRIPGADCNIYLAYAAAIASGLQGIKDQLPLPPINEENPPELPKTLREAVKLFENSRFTRQAFGDDVVDHYVTFYQNEQAAYDKYVTDWERHRYFEQI